MMMRTTRRTAAATLFAAASLLAGAAESRAGLQVTYSTQGTFASTGNNEFTSTGLLDANSTTVTFNGLTEATATLTPGGPALPAFLGVFSYSTTGIGSPWIDEQFTLRIFLNEPASGDSPVSFPSELTGRIRLLGYEPLTLTFDDPLFQTLTFAGAPIEGVPHSGTVTFGVPASLVVATTLESTSVGLVGSVSATAVAIPEPSTVALALSGLIPMAALGLRRLRRRAGTA